MISAEQNKLFTQVSAGTRLGDLLRRYWWPIAGDSEITSQHPVKAVRLLGEDLVLFRDRSGQLGLIQRHCPHRSTDLIHGIIEDCGIRCPYHGWKFAADGQCLSQPYEDMAFPERRMKDQLRAQAYPVRSRAGVIFAYLGPTPVPEIPDWEFFNWPNGFREVVITEIPCNWFQCQENSIDPVHFEWIHENWSQYLRGETDAARAPRHLRLAFDEFDYGFVYRRVREGTDENDPVWTIGRVCLWPCALFTGQHVEWRVPVDDENTLNIVWAYTRVSENDRPFVQNGIPTWRPPIRDADGRWIDTHVMNQDIIAWVGQGRISDRTQEHLGRSDDGIKLIRKRYLADIERIGRGEDPKAIVRDPTLRNIALPIADREFYVSRQQHSRYPSGAARRSYGSLLQAGQPDHVHQAFLAALAGNVENTST